ncbi:hypothetical protein D3C76_1491960 [compost metagenome]
MQLFDRGRRLGAGQAQVDAAGGRLGTPLGFPAQVEQAAVGQLQRHCATGAGEHLISGKQSIAFNEYSPDAFRGYCDDLANNAFNDGYDSAHETLRVTRSVASMPSQQENAASRWNNSKLFYVERTHLLVITFRL